MPYENDTQLNASDEAIPALAEQISDTQEQIAEMEHELETQQQIAYAADVFQVDVTVRTLLESLAEGVIVVDRKGRILLFNRRAEELFLYTVKDVQGKFLTMLLPERYAEIHASHIRGFFSNPRPRSMGLGLDLMARRSNGEEFPVEVSLSHLKTEVGAFGMAFITDISERKNWEWDLQTRNQELDTFSHMVAHDLKSSLSLLIGYGDLLRSGFTTMSEAEISEHLDTIIRSGYKMNSIIHELLRFAGLRNEEVDSKPVASAEIIQSALLRLTAEIKQKNAQIEIPDEFIGALGHGPWLEEVWLNYLSNAIKYGGQPPNIRIGSQREGELTRFWVTDNGPGLTPEEQKGLFEPFSRRHTDAAQGHGLGLSIAKRIVNKLGGSVGVSSLPGAGSTFYFTLPAVERAES